MDLIRCSKPTDLGTGEDVARVGTGDSNPAGAFKNALIM